MKKVLFIQLLILIFSITGCTSNEFESAIKEIYGEGVEVTENENSKTYFLDYSNKRDEIEKDSQRLQDKLDKIINSLAEIEYTDLPSKSDANTKATTKDNCLSNILKWETPQIRVLMITKRCIPDKGNDITLIITEK